MTSNKKREAVKVVLMDTQYVETDSTTFKAVVQKLTGKDCSVAWIKESNDSSSAPDATSGEVQEDRVVHDDGTASNHHVPASSMLSNGMSFKDLDRLVLEVPPPDELQWLYTDGL